ncbi:MAG: membrane dipeptidase [Gammaproteobacteria bacterium]|nr:membrane dipeptidase [Gammaproteobacteria bacterium]
MNQFFLGLLCLMVLNACASSSAISADRAKTFKAGQQAIDLAQDSIIVDGHIDVPYRVHDEWVDVTEATEDGDFDYPRAKAGGLNAPFMSIYVPSKLDGTEASTQTAHQLIDHVEAIVARAPDRFAIATSADDVEMHFAKGLISLPLGMENGAPVNGDLTRLSEFYDRGIRYITLTHAKSNEISDSSYDEARPNGGLSAFGKEVVREMNRLGIMVDISHVSDEAFYDAIEVTQVPMIASHSSLRTFTPGFERNMDDDMVKALAKNGGVIMINFGSTFLTAEARVWSDARSAALKPVEEKYGEESDQVAQFKKDYRAANPLPFATLQDVMKHIDYAVKLVGVDHVGLGSDYDGVGDSLPEGMKDASTYPNLVQALLDHNYSEDDIRKILGGNALRVWRAVEAFAQQAE